MMRLETLLWAMEWVESGLLEILEDPNEIGSKAWRWMENTAIIFSACLILKCWNVM